MRYRGAFSPRQARRAAAYGRCCFSNRPPADRSRATACPTRCFGSVENAPAPQSIKPLGGQPMNAAARVRASRFGHAWPLGRQTLKRDAPRLHALIGAMRTAAPALSGAEP